MKLADVAMWTRGQLRGADVPVHGVGIDSRSIAPGALFVALPGARTDGHDHVGAAAARGAAAALVTRWVDAALPQVRVRDAAAALADLASARRARSAARIVAITGSNGKTTVKTMLAEILAGVGVTHATSGNHNNEIGLPLTLLEMPLDAEYAVLEMGAGKPGDIAWLAGIARPLVGVVTNVAPAHLERLHTLEGVAETKGALYQALPASGVAVINADDAFARYFTRLAGARRCLRFGLQRAVEIGADAVDADGARSRFRLRTPAGTAPVALALPGRHNVMNALAAAAVATALEVPLAAIAAGLGRVRGVPGRLELHLMPGDWRLLDDSYNANPASLAAAIEAVTALPGKPWLVLGDMGELGPRATEAHARAGTLARERGIQRLWTTGPLSAAAAEAFGPGAEHFDAAEPLARALLAALHAGVSCVVKGSRAAHMERVIAALRADPHWGDRHAA